MINSMLSHWIHTYLRKIRYCSPAIKSTKHVEDLSQNRLGVKWSWQFSEEDKMDDELQLHLPHLPTKNYQILCYRFPLPSQENIVILNQLFALPAYVFLGRTSKPPLRASNTREQHSTRVLKDISIHSNLLLRIIKSSKLGDRLKEYELFTKRKLK